MLLVLVAHNGCTYELEAKEGTKVGKVQAALENLTGVALGQQILTLDGTKLDGDKTFGHYGVSEARLQSGADSHGGEGVAAATATAAESEPVKVFFYNKALLQASALPPKPEVLPALKIAFPQPQQYQAQQQQYFPLFQQPGAPAALRNLPAYERQFCFRVAKAKAHAEAAGEYVRICERLLAEQEVQALAIDSAQENVDKHYAYISNMYEKFRLRFIEQLGSQERLLETFSAELQALEKTQAHPVVAEEARVASVVDLLPRENLCKWHAAAAAMLAQFRPKAEELTSLFTSVKTDVEALFMTVPSVDITKLSERLGTNQQLLLEMTSIAEALEKDWLLAKEQLERSLGNHGGGGMLHPPSQSFLGECAALQSIDEVHASDHMPRIEECAKVLERFTKHCIDCKNAMSRCVHSQIKSIAVLQNRISVTRNKLSAYKEVAKNIEDACNHLNLVFHIPSAYYSCLAEVIRRQSFADIFSLHAQKFAESMSSLRQSEEAARHRFENKYGGLLPQEVVLALKLHLAPPICEVHVSPDEYSALGVALSDVRDPRAAEQAQASEEKRQESHRDPHLHLGSHLSLEQEQKIVQQMENASLKAQLALAVKGNPGQGQGGNRGEESHPADQPPPSQQQQQQGHFEAALEAKEKLISTLVDELSSKDRQIQDYESRLIRLEEASRSKEEREGEEKAAAAAPGTAGAPPPDSKAVEGSAEGEEGSAKRGAKEAEAGSKPTLLSKCTTSGFKVGAVALFVENDKGQLEALHFGESPHYYLSPESADLFRGQSRRKHVFGQIVHLEQRVADKDAQYIYSKEIAVGDVFHLVTICLLE